MMQKRVSIGASWVLAAVIAMTAAEAAGDTIRVRESAYVKGPKVLLGDVAEVSGEHAELLSVLEVTPAALPGAAKRIDAALLRARIVEAGLNPDDMAFVGPQRTTATTLHLDITKEMLGESLREFVEMEMPWGLDDTVVDVIPPAQDYTVPDGQLEITWRPNPRYGYVGMGAFRGEVVVDGKVQKTFFAKAKVETYQEVLVAAREIKRGDVFSDRNVRYEKHALSTVEAGAFREVFELDGMVARSTILPGQVVTERKVTMPRLVKRNQLVQVETRIGALVIQTRAQAMSDGIVGEVLTCRNPQSKEQFTGVLRRDGVVVVE